MCISYSHPLFFFKKGICAKPSMLYLGTGGVAGAGPRRGSLSRAVRALGGQPAAAVRVAEDLAVLFADLREQNGHSVQHVCQPATGPRAEVFRGAAVCSLCVQCLENVGEFDFFDFGVEFIDSVKKKS